MIKRLFDILLSLLGLVVAIFVLLPFLVLIWLHDKKSPLFIAPRVGKNGKEFKLIKLRTMVVNADKSAASSTSDNDLRITPIGKIVRKYKLDELIQLINVLYGHISLVGPRPNVFIETSKYYENEKKLLTIKPGITDFSSIVFSDEGAILSSSANPDQDYNDLIRFWKSSLGLIYIKHRNVLLDIYLICLTILNFFNRKKTLNLISQKILSLNLNYKEISLICLRNSPLTKITFNNNDFEIYK